MLCGSGLAVSSLLLLITFVKQGWCLGCMASICEGNDLNKIIDCSNGFCGGYKNERADGELVEGVDVECTPQSDVYSPIDGELYFWRPFGNREEYRCADEGVRIEGIGQWQGYHVLIASVALDFYGGKVRKGEKIGSAKDRRCVDGIDGEHYLRLQLFRQGKPIDPTFHLQNCMCTGQICESNPKNALLGPPFKHDSRYNGVRGWDIKCPMVSDDGEEELRAPDIYSPIDGEFIGRTRLYAIHGAYTGCDNNGIVIVGTGAWKDFEMLIYNVMYREKVIGRQRVVQGEPIATRLDCDNSPDSIFMEVRYRGTVVDVSDMITATSCKKPDFPSK